MVFNNYSELIKKKLDENNYPIFYVINGAWYGRLVAIKDGLALFLSCDLNGTVVRPFIRKVNDTDDDYLEVTFDEDKEYFLKKHLKYLGELLLGGVPC